jgi:serine/threonine protein kinase/Tfp pilus assembly protein PilF
MPESNELPTVTQPLAAAGRVLSHYRLEECLGQGGMGVVWKARDLHLNRAVALKLLPEFASGSTAETRFHIEAQAAAALDHPAICTIYEIDYVDGVWFIAMALINGDTLAHRIHSTHLSIGETVRICVSVAAGLEAAHARNIIHRDIKSTNIMITREGQVKILDFGIARVGWASSITGVGLTLGTPSHMSPEQVNGFEVDGRTDVWSLGVVLFESLAGRLPFRAENPHALRRAICQDQPPSLRGLRPDVTPELETIVRRALEKNPAARYASATDFRADLEAFLEQRPTTAPQLVTTTTRLAAAVPAPLALVVLPFVNAPPDPETEYFTDGLTDELINALAQIPELRVVSRGSAFAFKGKHPDLAVLAERLKVDKAIEGTVRRAGNKLRILVQLIGVKDGFQLWSKRFDAELEDVFAVQDEIARSVAEALKVKLVDETSEQPEPSFEVYNLYLQGKYHLHQFNPAALEKARLCFEQALEIDPDYARARAGLAHYHNRLAFFNVVLPTQALTRAMAEAAKALALDPKLAEAHATMGDILLSLDWDWTGAEREYLRGMELAPKEGSLRQPYALMLMRQGRFDEAHGQLMTGLKLDPLSKMLHNSMAFLFYYARDYDRTLAFCERVLEMDPVFMQIVACRSLTHLALGYYDQAIAGLRRCVDIGRGDPIAIAFLAYSLAIAKQTTEARQLLESLIERAARQYTSPVYISVIYIALEEFEKGFEWIEKGFEAHDPTITFLGVFQAFDPLRSDSRFPSLLRRAGLAESTHPSRLHLHGTASELGRSLYTNSRTTAKA